MQEQTNDTIDSFENAQGEIEFSLLNDYMFHIVFQENLDELGRLCAALLHIPKKEVVDITVENPIVIGQVYNDKTMILDLRVLLNNNQRLNIELQVANLGDWPDRSLLYLCRTFDSLTKGEEYRNVLPTRGIGITDFDLTPYNQEKEFYSTNMMMNVKTHTIYNRNFILNVLCLNQIELATEEDKKWELDKWAQLFKAKTWRDLKMLVEKSKEFENVAKSVYVMNEDEIVREACRRREENLACMRHLEERIAEYEIECKNMETQLQDKDAQLQDKDAQLQDKDAQLQDKDAQLQGLQKEIEQLRKQINK